MKIYDVLIVGGGFVGASLAHGIQQLGMSCALIDQSIPIGADPLAVPKDHRGLALSATSKNILHQIGVWEALAPDATPIKTVHVSKQGCFGITKMQDQQLGLPALGYLVDADQLGTCLHAKLSTTGVDKFWPISAAKYIFNPSQNLWEVAFTHSDTTMEVAARLLIAADGANSTLRELQGISANTYDYAETAIVSNVYLTQAHNNVAYERFTNMGTLALLPFGDQRMKIVWTVANAQARELLALTAAEFLIAVQQRFGYRLGKLIAVDARVAFPLAMVTANALVGENMLVMGNAANTLHPIAAQGLNLGLRDVATLIKVLTNAQQQGLELGSNDLLQQYADARQQDHATTQQWTHRLHSLFQGQNFGAQILQSLCLSACNLSTPIKKWVMLKALAVDQCSSSPKSIILAK